MNTPAIANITISYDTSTITATLTTGETLSVNITYTPVSGSDEIVAKSELRGALSKTVLIEDLTKTFTSLGSRLYLP